VKDAEQPAQSRSGADGPVTGTSRPTLYILVASGHLGGHWVFHASIRRSRRIAGTNFSRALKSSSSSAPSDEP
jgi:hypothetical protein